MTTSDLKKWEQLQHAVLEPTKLLLLQMTLAAAVPVVIADLQRIGGPDEWHLEQAREFSDRLGSEGDTLLFRVKGKTGPSVARFCEVVAMMAFQPGGVHLFGLDFEVKEQAQGRIEGEGP